MRWNQGGRSRTYFYVELLPELTISIETEFLPSSPDIVTAKLWLGTVNAEVVLELDAESGSEDDDDLGLLSALYSEAQRSAFTRNETLKKLDDLLRSDMVIGGETSSDDDNPY